MAHKSKSTKTSSKAQNMQPQQYVSQQQNETYSVGQPQITSTVTTTNYGTQFSNPQLGGASTQQYTQQPLSGIASNQYTTQAMLSQRYGTQTLSPGGRLTSIVSADGRRITGGNVSVISERVVEHEIKVPKKIVREEIIEKVVIVPEKILHEEVVEEVQKIREKIVEVARPIIQEKIVEVPEIEYIEKIIEVPERVVQERLKHVPKIEYRERIVEIPKIVTQEKIVEVPEIEYRDVPYEKIVEVPEIREEVVIREVPVPQYVNKPVPEYVTLEVPQNIPRNIPVPVEALTTFEFLLPQLKPKYNKVQIPIYAPRFVEVPIPAELMDANVLAQAEHLSSQVAILASRQAPSLCEVEKLAEFAKNNNFHEHLSSANLQQAIEQAWRNGTIQVTDQRASYMNAKVVANTQRVQ